MIQYSNLILLNKKVYLSLRNLVSNMDTKKEIAAIKQRNARVEADKEWETSKTRKVIIAVLTYLVIVLFLFSVGLPNPFVNAIVPTIGFVLSTLSLPWFKKLWVAKVYKRK